MDSSEKLHLLVISKSKRPRCFPRNVNYLAVQYEASSNAWMTADMFTKYVKLEDARFAKEKRQVCFIIDNFTAHPHMQGLRTTTLFSSAEYNCLITAL